MKLQKFFRQSANLIGKFGSWWTKLDQFIRRHVWILPILAILLVYWRLPLTYFEQDEWQAFETYIVQANKPLTDCVTIQRPLTCVINTIEWRLYGTNAAFYGLTSLVIISLIAIAFYRFLKHWPIAPYKAVLAAALFPIFVTGSQAVTWFGAFSASLPNFLFAVLALNFLIEDMKEPTPKRRLATVASVAASLYFKEESLWLFPVLLAVWWSYAAVLKIPANRQSFLRHLGPVFLMMLLFLVIERQRQVTGQTFGGLVSTTDTGQYLVDVLRALYLLPLQHLAHYIIPPEYIVSLSAFYGKTIIGLSTTVSNGLLIFFSAYFISRFIGKSNRADWPLTLTLIVWMLTGFVSYAVFGKNPEFLEGRYYFASQAPLVALLVMSLLPNKVPNLQSLNNLGVGVLVAILGINLLVADSRLTRSVDNGQTRKYILNFIREKTGPLPAKAIIYTETPNFGYVGVADHILPFQNGLATTLRVLYQDYNQDYRALAPRQRYLWDIVAQGYDEVDGIGFGYYRDEEKLKKVFLQKQLEPSSVFAFRYRADGQMVDLTETMRGRLTLLTKKFKLMSRDGWSVRTSNDAGVDERHGIDKILDANPNSDWSTSHKLGEYIEVDFGRPIDNVASVKLRTADGNSNPRFYRFESSPDGTNWQTDFEDESEVALEVPIYFAPKRIQKFRITITDNRPSIFNWSLSDINAYTAEN